MCANERYVLLLCVPWLLWAKVSASYNNDIEENSGNKNQDGLARSIYESKALKKFKVERRVFSALSD